MRLISASWGLSLKLGQLESTGTGGSGEGMDEMQNKAIAQPAWLQLAAGALAGA